MLRFNFKIPTEEWKFFETAIPLILAVRTISFFIFKTYSGIIFHTSIEDAQRIFAAVFSGSILLGIIAWISNYFIEFRAIPYSILIIDFMVTIMLMLAFRVFVKILYLELKNNRSDSKKVIIYGAGEAGVLTKKTLDRDAGTRYKLLAFIDNNKQYENKRLEGIEIFEADRHLERLLQTAQPDQLIISDIQLPAEEKQRLVELALKYKVKVLNVPPMNKWINGELSFQQIKEIRIEDLLEREPIQLDFHKIEKQLFNKTILITGAAGSIGSEIARQVIRFQPKKIILLDQAETPLHELDLELSSLYRFRNFETVIGDIRNAARMENVFKTFYPEIVYHAAAYKHVPLMESNPSEAVFTNLFGTKILADFAAKYEANRFVYVSTDKAVNPTSIMGASKRIAEIYIQSLNNSNKNTQTEFITTRFGNVLGSNGSVIPLFKKQIANGGPVTVTHPEMTRYFMTIPEACQLVLEAGTMGNGGEIFVFDMGKSIKILDLAKRMIRLSGLELDKDIHIVFSGLRPGEKLYEELLNQAETTLPTHHPKILKARVPVYPYPEIAEKVKRLIALFEKQENAPIVRLLKELIPEYKSNNSVFEEFDKK